MEVGFNATLSIFNTFVNVSIYSSNTQILGEGLTVKVGTEQILSLSIDEKLKLMELLGTDLSEGDYESPDWPLKELDRTKSDFNAEHEEVLSWAEAKARLSQ